MRPLTINNVSKDGLYTIKATQMRPIIQNYRKMRGTHNGLIFSSHTLVAKSSDAEDVHVRCIRITAEDSTTSTIILNTMAEECECKEFAIVGTIRLDNSFRTLHVIKEDDNIDHAVLLQAINVLTNSLRAA